MDAHQQLYGYGVTGSGLTYSSFQAAPSVHNKLFGSLRSDFRNSPSSPSLTRFDCNSIPTLSDSPAKENLSAVGHESCSYFHQPSSSLDCRRDSLQPFSSLLPDANCSPNITHALQQLETALMGSDDEDDLLAAASSSLRGSSSGSKKIGQWSREFQGSRVIQPQPSFVHRHGQSCDVAYIDKVSDATGESHAIPPGNLKQLLIACAEALSENNIKDFDKLIEKARGVVSISGEPIQRLGTYLVEGLVARKESSGANIYRALRCKEPESKDLLSYMQILYDICPYLKFGYMAANGAIAEACRNENRIHIVDFQIAQGTQWVTLLQALAARPGGPPHVRITGIDDPVSKYARNDGIEAVGRRLAAISERFNIPIEFNGVPVFAPDVTRDMLDVRLGEALAVNFPLQLHHTPDEGVDLQNPRDGLLRMVKSLNPKVLTLVEQESNTNTTPFLTRFSETLDYYLAMFESIDVTLPRDQKERIGVEQHCLARDIVNVIACEGKERVERHELFGKWKSRLTMAGFGQMPLSSYVNDVIRSLLRRYSEHYTLVEKEGTMLLGWKKRNLISASAWH